MDENSNITVTLDFTEAYENMENMLNGSSVETSDEDPKPKTGIFKRFLNWFKR